MFVSKTTVTTTNLSLAAAEIVTDITVSQKRGKSKYGSFFAMFTPIQKTKRTFWPNGLYNSNHLHGNSPRGGNILYQDAHTEWRQFRNMNWVTYDGNSRYAWF